LPLAQNYFVPWHIVFCDLWLKTNTNPGIYCRRFKMKIIFVTITAVMLYLGVGLFMSGMKSVERHNASTEQALKALENNHG